MKKKITNWLDNFFEMLEDKKLHIGDLEFYHIITYKINGKRERAIGFCPDCENCSFGWDCTSYEGECEDCGCYINYRIEELEWIICKGEHDYKIIGEVPMAYDPFGCLDLTATVHKCTRCGKKIEI